MMQIPHPPARMRKIKLFPLLNGDQSHNGIQQKASSHSTPQKTNFSSFFLQSSSFEESDANLIAPHLLTCRYYFLALSIQYVETSVPIKLNHIKAHHNYEQYDLIYDINDIGHVGIHILALFGIHLHDSYGTGK
mmetsp:Transcript_33284/g.48150  ORF Transcript_33284/g.48150 Transcript_33284/m.48150 type:complete len:134 (-) Transcript_33284:32-433(-)